MGESWHTLGPLTLQLHCLNQAQAQQIEACWQQLFHISPSTTQPACPMVIAFTQGTTLDQALVADQAVEQPAARYGAIRYWAGQQAHWLGCGDTLVRIARHEPGVAGRLVASFWAYSLVEQREFFLRIFSLLVRGQGMYLLHANALVAPVVDRHSGVLLVGDCGSGKTTLSLSLLQAGWRYVSDDSVLLAPLASAVMAHAVRRGFACTLTSAAHWPAMQGLAATALPLTRTKVLLQPEQLYPAAYQPRCHPVLLLFPQVTDLEQSRLTALDELETFLHLLAQPRTSLLVEPATAPGILALFQGLAAQGRGYVLELGMDVYKAPTQVAALLAAALP